MANRKVTVLNPAGFQEVLQSEDTLTITAPSELTSATFSGNVEGVDAEFTGDVTLGNSTPTDDLHAASKGYVDTQITDAKYTATLPIVVTDGDISINLATNTTVGSVRFATDAEASARVISNAAVVPSQLSTAFETVVIDGDSPITSTKNSSANYTIGIDYATDSTDGSVRFATDAEAAAGTATDIAITPAQVVSSIAAIPYATNASPGLIRIATPIEAVGGTANTICVTPLQMVTALDDINVTATTPINSVQGDGVRQWNISVDNSTSTARGVIRIATSAEVGGNNPSTDTVVTPALLEERLGGLEIVDGTTDTNGLVRFSTNQETIDGTIAGVAGECAVTPASLRAAMDSPQYVVDCGIYAE